MGESHPENALRFDAVRAGTQIRLSSEEVEQFERQAAALRKLLDDGSIKAKYKIEVLFGKARSLQGFTPGAISFWANGTKFHGGGDEKLYLCPGASLKRSECTALLQDEYNSASGAVCPACGTVWKQEQLIGELFCNLTMRNWAEAIYKYFRLCEYSCDIYLKHAPNDVRSVARAQVERQTWRGTQALDRARDTRARHIYPLRNIIKDTSSGADLLGRLYSFLTA